MKIYRYSLGEKLNIGNSVVALGFFDGVHLGHRSLIERAKETAKEKGLETSIFTFTSESFRLKGGCLYTTEERLSILETLGIDNVILSDFNALKEISAVDFIRKSLIGDIKCECAVSGEDFRFGKDALGNTDLLRQVMKENNKTSYTVPFLTYHGEKISTGKIKSYLSEGEVDEAKKLLSGAYFEDGVIEHGLGLGKSFGFPTLNPKKNKTNNLRLGVYRTATEIDGKLFSSVTNVGVCPTVGEREVHSETFVIGWAGDLYGKKIRVFYLGYLRPEIKFSSQKELIMQINVDKIRAIKENGELKWQEIGPSLQSREI